MSIPSSVRARIITEFASRRHPSLRTGTRVSSSLPIPQQVWKVYADRVVHLIGELESVAPAASAGSYREIRDDLGKVWGIRDNVVNIQNLLAPFSPFDPVLAIATEECASAFVKIAENNVVVAEGNMQVGILEAPDLCRRWASTTSDVDTHDEALGKAFNLNPNSVHQNGEFLPEWIFAEYVYQNSELLAIMLPHLASLGIMDVSDLLVAVMVVANIVGAPDPVVAYSSLNETIWAYRNSALNVARQAIGFLSRMEPARRRTTEIARDSWIRALIAEIEEVQALALADAYKRLLEGPFRQLAWAVYSLNVGRWEEPVMLGSLGERLHARGGLLAEIATHGILRNIRNSEAHETLVWDGFTGEYVTEEGRVSMAELSSAGATIVSFSKGAEAAFAAVSSSARSGESSGVPFLDEEGRMPYWQRVRTFFGLNGLRLTHSEVNNIDLRFRVEKMSEHKINPCFQAMVLSRRLIPKARSVCVEWGDDPRERTVVDADAIDSTMQIWEFVVAHLDKVPLSTFLPMNLDARMRFESAAEAVRSVSWIAVDDALGALDGSPVCWNDVDRALLDTRLEIVARAAESTIDMAPVGQARLLSVRESVQSLRRIVGTGMPRDASSMEGISEVRLLRHQWGAWGHIQRLPNIPPCKDCEQTEEVEPQLREAETSMWFRTI